MEERGGGGGVMIACIKHSADRDVFGSVVVLKKKDFSALIFRLGCIGHINFDYQHIMSEHPSL